MKVELDFKSETIVLKDEMSVGELLNVLEALDETQLIKDHWTIKPEDPYYYDTPFITTTTDTFNIQTCKCQGSCTCNKETITC